MVKSKTTDKMKTGEVKRWNPETGKLTLVATNFWNITTTPSGKPKIVDHNGFSVANLSGTVAKDNDKNAKLIAAAPDLLKALEYFVAASTGGDGSFHTSPSQMIDCYNMAKAAIQKAISK